MNNQSQLPTEPQASIEEPSTPPRPQPYGKRNWLKWGLIYLVIGLLLYVGVYYFVFSKQGLKPYSTFYPTPTKTIQPTPTANPTANWKTYTNKTYKYSVRYPSTLYVSSSGDSGVDFIAPGEPELASIKVRININNWRNFQKIYQSADDIVIPEEQHARDAVFTKRKSFLIDGYKAVSYTYEVSWDNNYTVGTIIHKNGDLIDISTWQKDTIYYNQILSTFTFTQ